MVHENPYCWEKKNPIYCWITWKRVPSQTRCIRGYFCTYCSLPHARTIPSYRVWRDFWWWPFLGRISSLVSDYVTRRHWSVSQPVSEEETDSCQATSGVLFEHGSSSQMCGCLLSLEKKSEHGGNTFCPSETIIQFFLLCREKTHRKKNPKSLGNIVVTHSHCQGQHSLTLGKKTETACVHCQVLLSASYIRTEA